MICFVHCELGLRTNLKIAKTHWQRLDYNLPYYPALRPMKTILTISAGIPLIGAVTSCATSTKYPEVDANGKKIEYVLYTPSGSNIPIKVRKDSMQMSDSGSASQDKAYTDLQRNSVVSPPPGTGSK
jgi:hypothetical protein